MPYEKIAFAISDYTLYQFTSEFVSSNVFTNGDSIVFNKYTFNIAFTLENNSGEILNALHIYKSPFGAEFGLQNFQLLSLENPLEDSERIAYLGFFEEVMPSDSLKEVKIIIPGANHKFNLAENIISIPDFQSDVTELDLDNNLNLFPNPTFDFINITSDKLIKLVSIYDSQGQLVLVKSSKSKIDKIDVSSLESGQYFIKTEDSLSKFIKQ